MRIVVMAVVALALTCGGSVADEAQVVMVANFPEVQRVDGSVSIDGPLSAASLRRVGSVVVSPVGRTAALNLEPQGTVSADGFTAMVVSLVGEVQGEVDQRGALGVVLVPDDELIVRALQQDGTVLFPLEASVEIPVDTSGWVSARSTSFEIAFPSYRVYLFNTSDKSVSTTVFVYLTNS